MSNDALQSIFAESDKRFEIFVPKPKSRINLGARVGRDDPTNTGPFGYSGISLQTDASLFMDCNKSTLFQATLSYCGQVGLSWYQFASADMFLSTTANMNVSAENKITIASGAGQGQITALDHGDAMRLVTYNSLGLHYTIDAIQVGLFEFFHGRHTRVGGTAAGPVSKHFASKSNPIGLVFGKPSEPLNKGEAGLEGGFLKMAARSLLQLSKPDADDGELKDPKVHGSHHALMDAKLISSHTDGAKALEKLQFGFSSYLSRFDPYAYKEGKKPLILLARLVAGLKRYGDVALKYGEALQSALIISEAIKLMGAVDAIVQATSKGYSAATDSFPALVCFERAADGTWDSSGWGAGGVADEWTSGAAARADTVESGVEDTRKAKITAAAAGPWDLQGQATWSLIVSWENRGARRIDISPVSARPASVTLTAPTLSSAAETKTLVIQVGAETREVALDADNTASPHAFAGALSRALIGLATAVPAGQAVTITSTTSGTADPPTVKLVDRYDTASLLGRMGVTRSAFQSSASSLRLGPPLLRRSGEVERLVLEVDGTPFTVDLTPHTNLAAALAAIPQLAVLANVSGSGNGPITVTTISAGASSRVRVRVGDPSRWGISPSEDEHGADKSDEQITAEQIVERLGDMDGATASVNDEGLLELTASKSGEGSLVEASGNLANLVFGSNNRDEITGLPAPNDLIGFGDVEAGYKTLVTWNHELQKLPEDTRNLTRPLTEAISDATGAIAQINNVLKRGDEIRNPGASPPAQTIGMFARDGITIGTKDRIVGSGGRGIVLIADGGTGDEDRARFVVSENWVKDWMDLNESLRKKIFRVKDKADLPEKRSLGFRVLSDSTVDLAGTTTAQLAALGRAKVGTPRIDGKTDSVGVGIARVIGSYAAEVVGYEKVVISARGKGTGADDSKMGRVELAGQTIAIGAASRDKWQGTGVHLRLTDFSGAPRFGIERLDLEASKLGGAEHLSGAAWDRVAAEHAQAAWSRELRDAHPHTEKVVVHGDTIVSRALPFKLEMSKEGMKLGFDLELFQEQTQLVDREVQALQAEVDRLNRQHRIESAAFRLWTGMKTAAQADGDAELEATADRQIALISHKLQQIMTEMPEQQARLAAAQSEQAARQSFNGPVPRIEMTMDAIRIGFVTPEGKWLIDQTTQHNYQGNWFQNVAQAKALPFLNLQKDTGALHVNPSFMMVKGKATLANGKGTFEVGKDTATMKFKQGLTAGDGSIKLEVKGGTIKLG